MTDIVDSKIKRVFCSAPKFPASNSFYGIWSSLDQEELTTLNEELKKYTWDNILKEIDNYSIVNLQTIEKLKQLNGKVSFKREYPTHGTLKCKIKLDGIIIYIHLSSPIDYHRGNMPLDVSVFHKTSSGGYKRFPRWKINDNGRYEPTTVDEYIEIIKNFKPPTEIKQISEHPFEEVKYLLTTSGPRCGVKSNIHPDAFVDAIVAISGNVASTANVQTNGAELWFVISLSNCNIIVDEEVTKWMPVKYSRSKWKLCRDSNVKPSVMDVPLIRLAIRHYMDKITSEKKGR